MRDWAEALIAALLAVGIVLWSVKILMELVWMI
jgi:hypothetical protein